MTNDFGYEKSMPDDFNIIEYYGAGRVISEEEQKARIICNLAFIEYYNTNNPWCMINAFLQCKENNLPILMGLRHLIDKMLFESFSLYRDESIKVNDRFTLDKAFALTPGKVRKFFDRNKEHLIGTINQIRFDTDMKINWAVKVAIKLIIGYNFKTAYDYYTREINKAKYRGFQTVREFTLTHAHMLDKSLDDVLKRYPPEVHSLIIKRQCKFPK